MLIKIVAATRYLVVIPVLGLALAAAYLFIAGGLSNKTSVWCVVGQPGDRLGNFYD